MVNGGLHEKGMTWARKSIELNPIYPDWMLIPIFCDHLLNGEYEAALSCALKIEMPEWWLAHANLAVAYGMLDRLQKARSAADALRKMISADELYGFLDVRFKSTNLRRLFFEGLCKAGLDISDEG